MKTFWDYQEEQNKQQSDQQSTEEKADKEQIVEKERQEVLDHVSSFTVDTIETKLLGY